jgi:DNA-binding transcriptional ArsR family regulator
MSSLRPRFRDDIASRALLFAALGDQTRLSLIGKLSKGPPRSISQLAEGSPLTRQAITKHLRVLEGAGVVQSMRVGRESLFEFRPAAIEQARTYLERVSDQWGQALARLKSFVER